jgi:hypothetical protein
MYYSSRAKIPKTRQRSLSMWGSCIHGFEKIKPSCELKAIRIPIDERRLKMNN